MDEKRRIVFVVSDVTEAEMVSTREEAERKCLGTGRVYRKFSFSVANVKEFFCHERSELD